MGDALHAVLRATGYNLRWLLRAMLCLCLKAAFLRPVLLALIAFLDSNHPRSNSINQNFRLAGRWDVFCRADSIVFNVR